MATTSFAQIFIIHRILLKNPKIQQGLVIFLSKEEYGITSSLTKMGLKQYLTKGYTDKHASIISALFKKMISVYEHEYESVLSFENNIHSDYIKSEMKETRRYESKLFNQMYLVPRIFQHLHLFEVNKCCLVNSIWLYHGYNINSIHTWDLWIWSTFDIESKKDDSKKEYVPGHQRFCQRLINCKKIVYLGWAQKHTITQSFINVYKSLNVQNLRWVDVELNAYKSDNDKEFVNLVCENTRKLEFFACGVLAFEPMTLSLDDEAEKRNVVSKDMSAIYLDNAKRVEIIGLLLPVALSNKCEKFKLNDLKRVNENWIENIIDNSNLSNINTLVLENVRFEFSSTCSKNDSMKILNAFGNKFINLKYFDIGRGVLEKNIDSMLTFWEALKPIIKKNNTMIKLFVETMLHRVYIGGNEQEEEEEKIDPFNKVYNFMSSHKFFNNLKCIVLKVKNRSGKNYEKLLKTPEIQSSVEKFYITPIDKTAFYNLFCDNNSINYNIGKDTFKSLMAIRIPYAFGGRYSLSHIIDFFNCQLERTAQNSIFFELRFRITIDVDAQSRIVANIKEGGNGTAADNTNGRTHGKKRDDENKGDNDFESQLSTFLELVSNMIKQEIPLKVDVIFQEQTRLSRSRRKVKKNDQGSGDENKQKQVDELFQRYYKHFFEPLFGKYVETKKNDNSDNSDDDNKMDVPKTANINVVANDNNDTNNNDNEEIDKSEHIKLPNPKCNQYCEEVTMSRIELIKKEYDSQRYNAEVMQFIVETARPAPDPFSIHT